MTVCNWEEYYPVEWLLEGGPPFSPCCPKIEDEDLDGEPYGIHADINHNTGEITWYISADRHILFKSTNYADIASYLNKYASGLSHWAYENRLDK